MRSVKKEDFVLAAEAKTTADYALVLQKRDGHRKAEAIKLALDSKGNELYDALYARNLELFKTGYIALM